jgi:hypothetical protein
MAGVPLKFRCYQCNQLLGVSRARIGKVVACPKCKADLIVPDPDEANLPSNGEEADSTRSAGLNGSDSDEEGISLELLDIRPEDIRVEPGVNWAPPTEPPPREPFPFIPSEAEPPAPEAAGADPSPIDLGELAGTRAVAPSDPPETLVPPIQLESTRIADTRFAPSRSRDVVLPRSAVATWSLFVLLAQGIAFVAGLLAGHFLWRVH